MRCLPEEEDIRWTGVVKAHGTSGMGVAWPATVVRSCRKVGGVQHSDVWLCLIDGTYRGIHSKNR